MIEITRALKRKFWNKRVNARKENIPFELTLDDFVGLMEIANITIEDLHIKGYHLSRYNDSGGYSPENCRFIYYLDNYAEKKVSDKQRLASSINMSRYNEKKKLRLV